MTKLQELENAASRDLLRFLLTLMEAIVTQQQTRRISGKPRSKVLDRYYDECAEMWEHHGPKY